MMAPRNRVADSAEPRVREIGCCGNSLRRKEGGTPGGLRSIVEREDPDGDAVPINEREALRGATPAQFLQQILRWDAEREREQRGCDSPGLHKRLNARPSRLPLNYADCRIHRNPAARGRLRLRGSDSRRFRCGDFRLGAIGPVPSSWRSRRWLRLPV